MLALQVAMKLEQGQIWQLGDEYLRIVTRERLAIEYKKLTDPQAKDDTLQRITKKEFCRLIKGAVLLPSAARGPASGS